MNFKDRAFYCVPLLILSLCAVTPNCAFAADKPVVIKSIDYKILRLSNGETVELAGLDMTNLASSKEPNMIFSRRVQNYLRSYLSKEVMVEYESKTERIKRVYLYYLTAEGNIAVDPKARPGEQPVVLIEAIRDVDGKKQAKLGTYRKVMLNTDLLRAGYARVDLSQSFKNKSLFQEAEAAAQKARAGIWG